MLTIGIVCFPSVGGSGVIATQLGCELAKRGHTVHFMSYELPFKFDRSLANLHFHKVEINDYELFKYPDYTLPLAVKIMNINKQYSLDILHVHYAVPHAMAALLAKNLSMENFPQIITTLHGTDITMLAGDERIAPMIMYAIKHSCRVTAVSHSLRNRTYDIAGDFKEIAVIHNFFSPKTANKSTYEVREALGVDRNDFLVIHLSNLRPVKRISHLLNIMTLVKCEHRIKLLILSGGDSSRYQREIDNFGLRGSVLIKDRIVDIENYICAADIGLYCSEDESFGMGILETMAYAKPVLATNVGGIPEVMKNDETGFLYDAYDIRSFAEKLIDLSHNPKKTAQLGKAASERAATCFSTTEMVGKYLDCYYETLKDCKY